MTVLLTAGVAFLPGQRQISFAGRHVFDVRRLLAVIHRPSDTVIYATAKGGSGLGYAGLSGDGRTLTLAYDTRALGANDPLSVHYDKANLGLAYSSDVNPTRLATGAGLVAGLDLFCWSAYPRLVKLFDGAAAPGVNDTPLLSLVLGGGTGRVVTLPNGIVFATGLWATTAARGTQPPAQAGDVAGSVIV